MQKLDFVRRACAVLALCAATAIALPAQTFVLLHSFDGTDGESSRAGLVPAADGNLYGTTSGGGAYGQGTVFKITPRGTLTTLYSFCLQSNCADGANPWAGLIQATDGNFYGTTVNAGTNGGGTVFKITPSGTLTTLHGFCFYCTGDGSYPLGGLIQATDGNFYGTTDSGGAGLGGTVFEITSSGTLTILYSFSGPDGAGPWAGLVQATDGNFYGTTRYGGVDNYNYGTVFKLSPSGTLTTLYNFCFQDNCAAGAEPTAALIQATDGNLYGTTLLGNDGGTVFNITPSGTLTTLYDFCSRTNCADGEDPYAGLIQDTNGRFYGTTSGGGVYGDGTVFMLSTGLAPFVETQPTWGKAGKVIKILGTNLTGATEVTFNGTPAAFKVISKSLIGATVPAGATTGTVQVTTPSGTLSSNVPFRVMP